MKRFSRLVGALTIVLVGVVSARAGSGPVAPGNYTIVSARGPGGHTYKGTVAIRKIKTTYTVAWRLPGQPDFNGVGIQVGETLGVSWGRAGRCGLVVYKIKGGRADNQWSLDGQWTSPDMGGAVGTERLLGPVGLDGTYSMKGFSPNSRIEYKGSVDIKPNGDTYTVTWNLVNESYKGVGVKQGDILVVGYDIGPATVSRTLLYRVTGGQLKGVSAKPGHKKTGTEHLKRGG